MLMESGGGRTPRDREYAGKWYTAGLSEEDAEDRVK